MFGGTDKSYWLTQLAVCPVCVKPLHGVIDHHYALGPVHRHCGLLLAPLELACVGRSSYQQEPLSAQVTDQILLSEAPNDYLISVAAEHICLWFEEKLPQIWAIDPA